MISKKTYDDIQKALVAVGKPRRNRKENRFHFLHFATCGSCGYSITAERHVKKSGLRFHYYRCTFKNRRQRCEDRSYVREDKFAEEVKRNAALVIIPDEWREKYLARIETWETEVSHKKQAKIDRLKGELASLKTKIGRSMTPSPTARLTLRNSRNSKIRWYRNGRIGATNRCFGEKQSQ